MKKIVFIENRYRTLFWGRMAGLLEEEGYEVFFIVENHSFSPHRKNVYQIPYPAVDDLKSAEDRGLSKKSDSPFCYCLFR